MSNLRRIRAVDDIAAVLGLPALAIIPDMLTPGDLRARRSRRKLVVALAIAIVAICAMVIAWVVLR